MDKRLLTVSIVALAAAAIPADAATTGVQVASGRYTINIEGFVPVICRASVDSGMVAPDTGVTSLGSLNEFCNDSAGYSVYADYSDSMAGGSLIVDGVTVPLESSGSSLVSSSDHAAITSRDLSLELPDGIAGGTLSFRIEPR